MKKIRVTAIVLSAILFACLLTAGCGGEDKIVIDNTKDPVGKLIILQAYGSASDAAGVSHSFVELYNKSDEEIDLANTTLWYADGTSVPAANAPNTATTDGAWKSIELEGKIPAKSSFLIMGPIQSETNARLELPDNYGDINDPNFILSNRAFKVALIYGANQLSESYQNPFTDGINGNPILGYVDMVGAANAWAGDEETSQRDAINGYEVKPARNSASEAVRRKNLTDTDNNFADFESIRYAADGISAEMLEVRKPRNLSAEAWNPFANPEGFEPDPDADYTNLVLNEVNGAPSANADKWFEIYNKGNTAINLGGVTVWYDNASGYALRWTFTSSDVIPANGFFATSYNAGLSANNANVKLQLRDPEGTVLDTYQKPADFEPTEAEYPSLRAKAHARIPDGTGDWYYLNNATGTRGTTNGTSTAGYTKFGEEDGIDRPVISGLSQTPSATEVTSSDSVTVSATITTNAAATITVVLNYKVNNGAENSVNMTTSGSNVYSCTIPAQADTSAVAYIVSATNNTTNETTTASGNYLVADDSIDYSPLMITEISGEHKYVEIYNSGTEAIPLAGVKLQRNEEGNSNGNPSEWEHEATDTIPAGAYRIYLFSSYTPTASTAYTGTSTIVDKTTGLETYETYKGWGNTRFDNGSTAGLSDQQILRIALIDPEGNIIDIFIRGDAPLPTNVNGINWGDTTNITRVRTHSYSRMSDGTWAYAVPTPGAANGTKASDILTPGYLTSQP